MAVVDLDIEKIVDCKKGSFTWWHEKGHIVFNKTDKGIKQSYYVSYLMGVSILFITFSLFIPIMKFAVLISTLMMIYYYAYEEVWCWLFAYKKIKERNKNGSRTI